MAKKVKNKLTREERAATDIVLIPSVDFSPSQETIERVIRVSEKISEGKSRQSIQKWIMDSYEISARSARSYYAAAIRYLMPDDMEEYKMELIQANIERLEAIIEDTMKTKGVAYTNAIQAIKELNKMLGLGDSGKMVAVETPDTKFVIKLGDD